MAIDGRTKEGKAAKAALAAQEVTDLVLDHQEKLQEAPEQPEGDQPQKERAETPIQVSEVPKRTDLDDMKDQIALLTRALTATRNPVDAEEVPICLVKTGGDSLSIFLDDVHGKPRQFTWDDPGEKVYLTPMQREEMQEHPGGRKFLDRGYVTLEDDVTAAMVDTARWIRDLDINDIDRVVSKMTDTQTMVAILNHIERTRVITEKDGRPLVDAEGLPRAEFKKLNSTTRVLFETLAGKVQDKTGARYSLTDG